MPERSLGQWLSYLERLHPSAIDLGLERSARVARALALIPVAVPVVTIAGTNGKGSVAHTCDAWLRAQGLRVGRYTSPHILHFNERITVDGTGVSDAEICTAFAAIESARGETSLSYFEFATLAALYCFRARAVDVMVLEVGLGGRLDAVNIVDAQVAVITAIDLDHQEWLGNTLEAIGREKAGIGRPRQRVVMAEADYPDSVAETLKALGAQPLFAGDRWHWRAADHEVELDLLGAAGGAPATIRVPVPAGLRPANVAAGVQAAALVLSDLRTARGKEDAYIDVEAGSRALATLAVPGRRQRIACRGRTLVLDVAHNPAAMTALAQWLRREGGGGRCYAALGVLRDKDLPAMAAALAPAVDGAYAVALPGVPRAQDPERCWQVLDSLGIAAQQSDFTVAAVWEQLQAGTSAGDTIVFCGSFHTVAGIMAHLDLPLSPSPDTAQEIRG